MARLAGSNKKFREAVKIAEKEFLAAKFCNKHFEAALNLMADLMYDKDLAATNRFQAAKFIIDATKDLQKKYGDNPLPKDFEKKKLSAVNAKAKAKEEAKDEIIEDGGLISLKFEQNG